ncbi:Signal recognition particle receptor FtsY [Apilactobacillus kunkeei]|uniref:signal recognition particle-docking protein FtsY n=1 Tax=Apilactobacillus kunkeei TaxID=148814 RepID=UPI0006CE87C6|nr:signal recognition particle-docking protein FtsY [Apilactobacillus kunkeei]KPN82767.1 Signal recognition particle receptor FtsY [Apilactobacillus kunkeei]MCK8634817.1 signal recognition particle-docking protein FtsY [Apilactobacillus kunkeei]
MGLFDIFKKRNNEEEKNNSKVEEVKSDETAAVDDEQKTDDKVDQVSEQATVTSEKEQEPSDQEEDSKESDVDDNADEEKVEEQTVEEQPAAEKPVEDDQTKFTEGLEKSRSTFGERLNRLFANFRSVDEDFFEDLEDTLIESDVGFDMAVNLTDQLRDEVKLQNAKSKDDVQNVIIQKMIDIYDQNGNDENTEIHFASQGPTVILFVGVNGVGKTTTIGKMANMYKQQGKKVLLAAADTFRAGAIQQLDEWAKRDGVDIVKKPEQSDPSAVVYEAVHKAKDENYDILFVDTAGRLQNKVNLMNELAKMKKVLTREIPDAPHEVLLVLDSTTGQNALNQAKLFKETTNVSGIVLTKLDGTAKGGIVLAIRNELHVPVKYVGLGEKVEDLREFNANDFVYGLFKGLIK